MAEAEDTKILSAISTATTTATGRNTTQVSTGGLTRATLAALFAEIEQHDAPVANIIMHPTNYKDIRGWAKDEFDPVTKREMLKTGYVGEQNRPYEAKSVELLTGNAEDNTEERLEEPISKIRRD